MIPPVPTWKKWLMLAFVLGFVVAAAILMRFKASARGWDPNQSRGAETRR
jgi:hypothetical protein